MYSFCVYLGPSQSPGAFVTLCVLLSHGVSSLLFLDLPSLVLVLR